MAIPGFGNLPFKWQEQQANDDTFASVGGGELRTPIGDGYCCLADCRVRARKFQSQQFDTQNGDANIGVTKTVDKDVYTLMAQTGVLYLDDGRYRNHTA